MDACIYVYEVYVDYVYMFVRGTYVCVCFFCEGEEPTGKVKTFRETLHWYYQSPLLGVHSQGDSDIYLRYVTLCAL